MKRWICILLVFCLMAGTFGTNVFADGEVKKNIYDNLYSGIGTVDISSSYEDGLSLARILSAGVAEGEGNYVPECGGELTKAEAIAIAARLHSLYFNTEISFEETLPWYKAYLDYAIENDIVSSGQSGLYFGVNRLDFASMLSNAVPKQILKPICSILDGCLYDVDLKDPRAEGVYELCRAGVFTGVDENGTFRPYDTVLRSEVDDIITRIAMPTMRIKYDVKAHVGSTVPRQSAADDEFFADACIIGNSLVEGIRLYSRLKSLTYYSGTGMTVVSAANKNSYLSKKGYYDSAVGAAASGNFSKVYIELGINEIGLPVDSFIAYYSNIIDRIQSGNPEADIYILSLTPVSRNKDRAGTFTMQRINGFNEALKKLAIDKNCYYLDCVSPLVDETGFLPAWDTWDGVHFEVAKYSEWENVIRTHYAE